MSKGVLLDLDTWIVPGQILTGKPPPGSGNSCKTSRYGGYIRVCRYIILLKSWCAWLQAYTNVPALCPCSCCMQSKLQLLRLKQNQMANYVEARF